MSTNEQMRLKLDVLEVAQRIYANSLCYPDSEKLNLVGVINLCWEFVSTDAVKQVSGDVLSGKISPNQGRLKLGLPPLAGGDAKLETAA